MQRLLGRLPLQAVGGAHSFGGVIVGLAGGVLAVVEQGFFVQLTPREVSVQVPQRVGLAQLLGFRLLIYNPQPNHCLVSFALIGWHQTVCLEHAWIH